jgi:hypothetical protein
MTAIIERPDVSHVDRKCELIWWREQAARTDKDFENAITSRPRDKEPIDDV